MFISTKSFSLTLLLSAILVRWLVSQFPYSGYGTPPLYGDYEAQRHWMEITTNLPITEWYKNSTNNDLLYWGLDYPPLTAYHMYLLGKVSCHFNESWTELYTSRGTETYDHKIFMRATVMLADVALYIPGIVYYFLNTQPIFYAQGPSNSQKHNTAIYTALALMYPAQILIDHGHFQYNCTFMGLMVWAVILMSYNNQVGAAIIYTLALCYKQMSLYYSLPFFWYIASTSLRQASLLRSLGRIIMFGFIVGMTFSIIFMPYLGNIDELLTVLHRIFPFARGLFEDKVANLWFVSNIYFKFKDNYQTMRLLKVSTALTVITSLPAGVHILFRPTLRSFKYSLVNTSLAFFLLSFQVHEKTILVPALPILLLYREHPLTVNWFLLTSTFSLQPLLLKDGQLIPYCVLITAYTLISFELFNKQVSLHPGKIVNLHNFTIIMYLMSILGCFILSAFAIFVNPPQKYPDLHPTINAIYSCAHFTAFLLFFYYKQFFGPCMDIVRKNPSNVYKTE